MPPFWLWPYACWPSATGPGSTRSEFSLYLEPSYVCHKPMCSGSLHGIISRWQIFSNCSTCCCHQHSTLSVVTTDEWLHADANSATVLSQPFQSQKAAYCKHMLIHFMLLCLPHKLKHLVCVSLCAPGSFSKSSSVPLTLGHDNEWPRAGESSAGTAAEPQVPCAAQD